MRQQFISAAAFLIEEMHVDGLRIDLTQAIHRDNQRHSDQALIPAAKIFGQKLLREWSRTLRMIRPDVMLVAEDHTGWDAVTKPPSQAGLRFQCPLEGGVLPQPHRRLGHGGRSGTAAEECRVSAATSRSQWTPRRQRRCNHRLQSRAYQRCGPGKRLRGPREVIGQDLHGHICPPAAGKRAINASEDHCQKSARIRNLDCPLCRGTLPLPSKD